MKCCLAFVLLSVALPSFAATPIHIDQETRSQPPLHLHFAVIDLSDPTVLLRVIRTIRPTSPTSQSTSQPTDWETTLQLPSDVADRDGLCLAINGDLFAAKESVRLFGRRTPYFIGNAANVCGWAMSDGVLWARADSSPALLVLRDGSVRIGTFRELPANTRQAVGGSNILVFHGRNVSSVQGKDNQPYPRTAAGIDGSGRKLVLLVVDGHRPDYSSGLTSHELGDEMIRHGCVDAINLDGGGSSVMVAKENGNIKIISRPSDGYDLPLAPSFQRPVASVLGVICATQPSIQ